MKNIYTIIFLFAFTCSASAYQIDPQPDDFVQSLDSTFTKQQLTDPDKICANCAVYVEGVQENILEYHTSMIFDDSSSSENKATK